jgi:translation initiation factor 5A
MQVHIPLIDKRMGQIISMTDAGIQVMDSETFETVDVSLVEDEIKDKIQQGQDIEYWNVMGRVKIMRIKG